MKRKSIKTISPFKIKYHNKINTKLTDLRKHIKKVCAINYSIYCINNLFDLKKNPLCIQNKNVYKENKHGVKIDENRFHICLSISFRKITLTKFIFKKINTK